MNERKILLLAAFAAARVEYAVVGGVAVNAHGYVRATHDLHIFIRPTEKMRVPRSVPYSGSVFRWTA